MDISVIFTTYRRNQTLRLTLDSLAEVRFSGDWEVIIVDNAADPKTEKLIKGYSGKIPVKYFTEKNNGKNFSLNAAVKKAEGDIFVFTDNDIIAPPDWIEKYFTSIQRWPEHKVFGGRVLPRWTDSGPLKIDIDENFRNAAYCIADWNYPEGEFPAGKVWGPNMAIRRSVFDGGIEFNTEVGPSKNNYIMGSETELTTRLENMGYKAVYLPDVVVRHQIREEQLTAKWLVARAFRYGRSFEVSDKQLSSARIFGMPRYIVRIFCTNILKSWLTFDSGKKLNLAIKNAILRGQIKQIKEKLKNAG